MVERELVDGMLRASPPLRSHHDRAPAHLTRAAVALDDRAPNRAGNAGARWHGLEGDAHACIVAVSVAATNLPNIAARVRARVNRFTRAGV